MARKTFCYDKNGGSINGGEIDKNSDVLIVILSFNYSQETNTVISNINSKVLVIITLFCELK